MIVVKVEADSAILMQSGKRLLDVIEWKKHNGRAYDEQLLRNELNLVVFKLKSSRLSLQKQFFDCAEVERSAVITRKPL